MKRLLPKSINNPKGFTLIEIMVAISIIAILSVIGFVSYQGISARARDARRIDELTAIQKAMEKNYQPGVGYVVLAGTDFSSGVIPVDPLDGKSTCGTNATTSTALCRYCAYPIGSVFGNGTCTVVAGTTGVVGSALPAAGAGYAICANLETNTGHVAAGVAQRYFCVKNLQ